MNYLSDYARKPVLFLIQKWKIFAGPPLVYALILNGLFFICEKAKGHHLQNYKTLKNITTLSGIKVSKPFSVCRYFKHNNSLFCNLYLIDFFGEPAILL